MNSKILIVINSLSTGGAERQVVTDANILSLNGNDVTVAFHQDGVLKQDLAKEIKTYKIISNNEIVALFQLIFYFKKCRFDEVFGHMFWAHKVVAFPCWLTGHKYVFFEHGLGLGRKWYHLLLLRLLDKSAAKIATVSEAKKTIKINREKTPAQKIVVIHNCFSQEKTLLGKGYSSIPELTKSEVGKILFMGRFNKVKQLDLLIAAAGLMVQQRGDFHFTLCGNGPDFAHISALIKDSNLEKYFSLPGYVDKPYAYLLQGDIFVLPSRVEDFSVALLEAGYAGLPALAFDVGGNREIIVDGATGFIIKPYDVKCFADKLLLLINNRELCRQMGHNGKERVMGNFSEKNRLADLSSLIASL